MTSEKNMPICDITVPVMNYLIEYYLKDEGERDKIAQAGYELVISNHTYKN